jgi:S1-C subfamily serine protease
VNELEPTPEPFPQPEEKGRHSVGSLLRRGAPLLVAGVLGAGVAVGIGAAVADDGGTTTVVREVTPASASAPAAFIEGSALSVQEIYRRSAPGVVQITATSGTENTDPFGFGGQQQALGSGFVIDKAGHIITNYHVVADAQEVSVNFSSGRDRVPAKIVGSDPSTDIAVLKVDMAADALTPIPLGDSDEVEVGDPVVAIGNPFGLDRTVTAGIVSAVQREITAPNGFPIEHVIQTDAAINHGNSGGPLIDAGGQVIGVNAQITSGGLVDGNVGIGFAVPINTAREVAAQLIESGKVEHAYLGIEMETITPELADSVRVPVDEGVLIAAVRPGSPAEKAGLRGGDEQVVVNGQTFVLGGDVITKADGRTITDADELRDVVLSKQPGDAIELEINRDGEVLTVTAELGSQPATPAG